MTTIRFELDWLPPAKISGNKRGHWRTTEGIIAQRREDAMMTGLEYKQQHPDIDYPLEGALELFYSFYSSRDVDNLVFGMKAFMDGLADAGLFNDDKQVEVIVAERHKGDDTNDSGVEDARMTTDCKLCGIAADTHFDISDARADHAYLPDNGKYHFSEPSRQQYVEERMPGGRLYDDGEDWREWGDELSPEASASNIAVEVWQRFTNGIKKFGPRFLGQPVPAIKEEAYDILRYADMTEKQIAWLTAENERLRSSTTLRPLCTCCCDSDEHFSDYEA